MVDPKSLLDSFLGADATRNLPDSARQAMDRFGGGSLGGAASGIGDAAQRAMGSLGGAGPMIGAAAAGGLLALLLGGKRRSAGGLLSHGGAAALGALAHRAWQNWQASHPPASAPVATPAEAAAMAPRFLPGATPAAGGEAFELALIRAMIGAARADGHVDEAERARIFEQVEKVGLDAEAKAFVFDTLDARVGVSEVAASAATPEQAAEIYLVSRLTIDPDRPDERAYLAALAHRLRLDPALVAHLDRQADGVAR